MPKQPLENLLLPMAKMKYQLTGKIEFANIDWSTLEKQKELIALFEAQRKSLKQAEIDRSSPEIYEPTTI